MIHRHACILLIIWCFCLNCSEPTKPKDGESKGIIGKWNWLETFGVESRLRSTPQSVGYTMAFRFDPDSIFYHYRNDTVTVSGHCWITFEVGWCFWGPDTVMVLRTDKWTPFGSQWGAFFNGAEDTLSLKDLAFDAAEHRFVRIK